MSRDAGESVLLLHGLWMNRYAMGYLAHALRREGYAAEALAYRSTFETPGDHLRRLSGRVAALGASRVHLVGHSFGGVMVLRYLQNRPDARVGRTVLLGAPVAGSRSAAALARSAPGRFFLGASLAAWNRSADVSLEPRFEVGVIAGTRSLGLGQIVSRLPRPNDGVVCVDETRLPGARAHLALPVGHTEMLISRRVARQTAAFLKTGAFAA